MTVWRIPIVCFSLLALTVVPVIAADPGPDAARETWQSDWSRVTLVEHGRSHGLSDLETPARTKVKNQTAEGSDALVNDLPQTTGVLAIAFGLAPDSPTLNGYIGDPSSDTFDLPAGSYYIEAVDQDGLVVSLGRVELPSDGLVGFPPSFQEAGGVQDATRARQLKVLAGFVASAELARFTALENSSANFTAPLFDPSVTPGQAGLDQLYDRYTDVVAGQADVLAALDRLEDRATAAAPVQYASLSSMVAAKGVFSKIKDSLLGFFGYAGDAGKRAADRINTISAGLSPGDKQDAFESIRPDFRGGAKNYDEFLQVLGSGKLNTQAAQIESDLRNSPGFAAGAQQAGATVDQVAAKEGAELVSKGAELNVKVIKTVLGDVFPDITKGFELADKAAEWAQYAEDVYKNPLGQLEAEARDWAKEQIKERIKDDLTKSHPELGEEIINRIAGTVSDKVVGAVPQLAPNPATGPAAAGTVVVPDSTPTVPATTDTPILMPTDTPTPDTSWIDNYVQGIADDLINQGYDGIAVAVVTDDLRQCLYAAVISGQNQSDALALCAATLSNLATPTPTATPPATNTPTLAPTNTPARTSTPVPTNTPAPTRTPVPTAVPPTATPAEQYNVYVLGGIGFFIGTESYVKKTPSCYFTGGGLCPNNPPWPPTGIYSGPFPSIAAAKADLKTKLQCQSGYWGPQGLFNGKWYWLQNNVGTGDCKSVKYL